MVLHALQARQTDELGIFGAGPFAVLLWEQLSFVKEQIGDGQPPIGLKLLLRCGAETDEAHAYLWPGQRAGPGRAGGANVTWVPPASR